MWDWTKDIRFNRKAENVNYHRNGKKANWKDPMEDKGLFRIYVRVFSVIIAIGLVIGTISSFKYLGGITGILTAELVAAAGLETYLVSLGMIIGFPILSILLLYLSFKRR